MAKDLAWYWEIRLLFLVQINNVTFFCSAFSVLLQSQSTFIWATRILIFSHKSIPPALQQILPLSFHLWQFFSSKQSPRNKHHIPWRGCTETERSAPSSTHAMLVCAQSAFLLLLPCSTGPSLTYRSCRAVNSMPRFLGLLTIITKSCGKQRHQRLQPPTGEFGGKQQNWVLHLC